MISLFLLFCFIGAVGLDQASKRHAQRDLLISEEPVEEYDTYLPGMRHVFSLGNRSDNLYFGFKYRYSRNRGAAFSMFSDLPDWFRVPFFYGVTIFALLLIGFFLNSTPHDHHFTRFGLIMIASGAIGNFIDRFTLGYVIDFLDVDWTLFGWYHDFAIFNVADVCINIGVICMLIDFFIKKPAIEEKASTKRVKPVKSS